MKITRKYYDLYKAELEKISLKCYEEKMKKTPEEIAGDEIQMQKKMESCLNYAGKSGKNILVVPDRKKRAEFWKLCKRELVLAKIMELNIEIDTDHKLYSTIEFTAEQFFFVENGAQEIHTVFKNLFLCADETWIDQKENLVRILFFFQTGSKTLV